MAASNILLELARARAMAIVVLNDETLIQKMHEENASAEEIAQGEAALVASRPERMEQIIDKTLLDIWKETP